MFGSIETLHQDPVAPVIFGVTGVLFFALIGRLFSRRIGQPSVLGELTIGILLGNIGYFFGADLFIILREGTAIFDMLGLVLTGESMDRVADAAFGPQEAQQILAVLQSPGGDILVMVAHVVDVFSRYGVIFLLFLIGLDNSIEEMASVGWVSVRVALIGVLAPFLLGLITVNMIAPELSVTTDMFVGAALVATSVGITASVLQEMRWQDSLEGKIILGAAVLDDVFGLLILAIVSGIVVANQVQFADIVQTVVLACGFLLGAVYLGPYVIRAALGVMGGLGIVETKVFTAFLFVMVLSWVASLVGLAAIIGAFAAGLILHEGFFKDLPDNNRTTIKELFMPLEIILAPIFFVVMGMQVKLETFAEPGVLLLAAFLLVAAVAGKIISGWGARGRVNRWLIGFGMLPRGEVGLIFASLGRTFDVLTDAIFSAVVLVVVLTTLLAPAGLKAAGQRGATSK